MTARAVAIENMKIADIPERVIGLIGQLQKEAGRCSGLGKCSSK
jgi:hypothetical protein